jgi:DNA (cytosine-5)-methyltransferase 1
MNMKSNKITFIDLFSGCGGLTEGFLQSGHFDAIAHVEWELPMVRTLRNRLESKWSHKYDEAKKRVVHFDIQKVDELLNGNWNEETINTYGDTNDMSVVKKGLNGLVGDKKIDLIIGGPPCQAYSIPGRTQDKNSMQHDYRNYLFESFIKVVDAFKPSMFVFENVPGILSAAPGGKLVIERIHQSFMDHGYQILEPHEVKSSVFSSSAFGVPQERK